MAFSKFYRYGAWLQETQEYRRGYLDLFDFSHQFFYRDLYLQIGKVKIKLKRELLFSEEVPQFALIDKGIFGETYWRSDCPVELHAKCHHKIEEAV